MYRDNLESIDFTIVLKVFSGTIFQNLNLACTLFLAVGGPEPCVERRLWLHLFPVLSTFDFGKMYILVFKKKNTMWYITTCQELPESQ